MGAILYSPPHAISRMATKCDRIDTKHRSVPAGYQRTTPREELQTFLISPYTKREARQAMMPCNRPPPTTGRPVAPLDPEARVSATEPPGRPVQAFRCYTRSATFRVCTQTQQRPINREPSSPTILRFSAPPPSGQGRREQPGVRDRQCCRRCRKRPLPPP